MSRLWPRRIGLQIALGSLAIAILAMAILAVGVWLAGGNTFAQLMAHNGQDAAEAHQMFNEALAQVLVIALVVAAIAAALLAILVGARLARPLADVGRAAQRLAEGAYGARLGRGGPEEVVSLVDSFNQMAGAIEEQERMRREFIANAAHELRTPLTNLQGYLEGLRDGVITPDRAVFESLWEEADRLVRLSRSLDQLAEGDFAASSPHVVELDLDAAIRAAVDLVRPVARSRDLTIRSEVAQGLTVRADPDYLAQVLANLLQNAVRYTPPGGRVTVRAERRPADALVSVLNTGDGIPAEDLPHVFERFYRVEKSRDRGRGGAGVGLAIVRQLIESAGGRVGVDSAAGMTRFWFTVRAP